MHMYSTLYSTPELFSVPVVHVCLLCLFPSLPLSLSVCPCTSVWLSACLCASVFMCPTSSVHVCLSVCLSLSLTVCQFVGLSWSVCLGRFSFHVNSTFLFSCNIFFSDICSNLHTIWKISCFPVSVYLSNSLYPFYFIFRFPPA